MDEKSTGRKRCSLFWEFITFIWTLTIQISIVLSYCLIGACLFRSLESRSSGSLSIINQSTGVDVHKLRSNTVLKLWNITDQFNVLYKENWTSLVAKEMEIFQSEIIHSIKTDPDSFISDDKIIKLQNDKEINTSSSKWSLQKSFLYSFSIITTMGMLPKISSPNFPIYFPISYPNFPIYFPISYPNFPIFQSFPLEIFSKYSRIFPKFSQNFQSFQS